jgi:hypothetical protein
MSQTSEFRNAQSKTWTDSGGSIRLGLVSGRWSAAGLDTIQSLVIAKLPDTPEGPGAEDLI